MTIHIGAKPGDIAETVLLPGDPRRAKWAAETFLADPVCVNEVRGMLGYTGTWKGNRVTIHGTGMGMPSLSIYVTPSKGFFRDLSFAPCADWGLLRAAAAAAEAKGTPTHVGGIYSADVFYDERPDLNQQMTRHGVLAVEMEAAELYTVAARFGCRALAVLTISDHLLVPGHLTPEERESSFGDMVEIALTAAFS